MMKTFNGVRFMKRFFYTLGIVAAAAFTFSACQKEQSIKDEQPSEKLVTVTFIAEKAGVDTRTAAMEGESVVSFKWTEEDLANIKLFEVGVGSDGKETLTVVNNPTITKVSDTQLTISASVAPGDKVFRAVLSGKWTNDGTKPRLNESQNPLLDSFDPSADVLVSEDMEIALVDSGEETVHTRDLLMVFHRPIVVSKMILKNLTEGESINKVIISSSKSLAGSFNYTESGVTASGDKTSVTLNYTNATVPEGGQFPVYFTTIPGTAHVLTVEVTTNESIYTKSFAEGKSIDFKLGQFTKFNFALPAGVPNTALELPVEDDMVWATTGASDATAELTDAQLTAVQGEKKIYDTATKVYKGADGMKFGSSSVAGSITTNAIDLSSDFYIAIEAKAYGSDKSILNIQVDGAEVYSSSQLKTNYETYYVNCQAATSNSVVTLSISEGRGYITDLVIGAGSYVAPPVIVVSTESPMSVSNENDLYSIEYSISNPTEGVSISAASNVSWIHSFDYSTDGEISFEVDAQDSGAAAREGIITLSYLGASDIEVVVSQAAGEGGMSTYNYVFTNKDWNATLNGEAANWVNIQSGTGTDARGISVQKAASGAGASSSISFTGISNVTVTLSRSSNGVGSVDIYVGDRKIGTQSTFTTSATAYSFDVDNLNGNVSFVVTCTTSTIYVKDISITAVGTDDSGSGGEGGDGDGFISKTYSDFTLADGVVSGGDEVITITQEQGEGTNAPAYTSPIRLYQKNTLTISCTTGYTIGEITFNMNGTYSMESVSSSVGSMDDNVWNGNSSTIVFTNNGSQARINSITVKYKENN